MTHFLRISLAIAALPLAACASSGAVAPPAAPRSPAAWSRTPAAPAVGAQDLSRWWQQLDDPVLSGTIEQALKASPDIRSALARLKQVRAQQNLAEANRLPSMSGSVSGSGSKRGESDATGSVSTGVDASWEPDLFGRLDAALQAARADLAATEDDLRNVQVSLAAEVGVNYVELRGLQERLRIARSNLAMQAETLQLTEWRAQAGLVSSVDVEQARANLAQTRAQVPSLEASIEQVEHRLAVLAGLEPAALKARLEQPAGIPAPPDAIAIGIPAETLRQRPDVRAAEQQVIAETARLAQAKAARFPSFSLRGSIGTDTVTGAMTGGTSVVASLVGSLVQTIFDGGRIRQQIAIQDAAQERAVASYEAVVLAALEEVENALVAIEKNREREASLATAVEAAHNAALLARQLYEAGLADFQRVLDTERSVLSAEDSLASTRASRTTAVVQLYRAVGGGWSESRGAGI